MPLARHDKGRGPRKTSTPKRAASVSRPLGNLRSEMVIGFIESMLQVPEGSHVGEPLRLRDWQKNFLRAIYDNPAGTRRAILSMARKNGKTALLAALVIVHLACKGIARRNSVIVSSASSRDQAAILFDLAAKMVRQSPALNKLFRIGDTRKEISYAPLGTVYRALSADATTAHGLSVPFAVHDELARVRGPRSALYDVIESGMGAHDEPLSIIISTQAPSDGDLLSILIDEAAKGTDPRTVMALYTAAPEMETFSEGALRAANPAFGDFLNAREALDAAVRAEALPAEQPAFENLRLNRRVAGEARFVSETLWAKCGAAPRPLEGQVFGGLDLSKAAGDMTALALISNMDSVWNVHPMFWLPGDNLVEKARADRAAYDQWAKDGHLIAVPGRAQDYDVIARALASILFHHGTAKIAYDPWNWSFMRQALVRNGMPEHVIENHFVEFRQGWVSMSPALCALESALVEGTIAHGNHPALTEAARNAVVVTHPAGNRKLDKKTSTGRIDGLVALTMAIGIAPSAAPIAPVPDDAQFISIDLASARPWETLW